MTDISRFKRPLFYTTFFCSLVASLVVTGWHMHAYLLPLVFMALGFISYMANPRKAMLLFLFLSPVVNSLPDLFYKGYPYNYIAVVLFYLSGMILAAMKRKEKPDFHLPPFNVYAVFLTIMLLSILFVLLRWTNITISPEAFFQDTPVAPSGERLSFAILFPMLTLFLFAVPPFLVPMLRRLKLEGTGVLQPLRWGFGVSFVLALVQRFISPDFLCRPIWAQYRQYNGGNSDFNAFGFFGGFVFLAQTVAIIRRIGWEEKGKFVPADFIFLGISLAGVVLSGSRTAFLFVLAAVIYGLSSKAIKPKIKIAALLVLIILLAAGGGVLKHRLVKTYEKFVDGVKTHDWVYALDRATNKRITMLKDSGTLLAKHWPNGVGTGNFLFYHKYMHYNEEFLHDLPLNQYLLLLDETGIIGLLLFIWFLVAVMRRKGDSMFTPVFVTILAAMLVGNSLWLPELAILFWIAIAMMGGTAESPPQSSGKRTYLVFGLLIVLFLLFNIRAFQSLHPLHWSKETNTRYDYGFWQPDPGPEGQVFRWTKGSTGMYVWQPQGKKLKLFAGAPVHKLEEKRQAAELYWNGKPFKIVTFTENRMEEIPLSFNKPGFLELRTIPTFNLKRMGLGPETRDLGIQFYHLDGTPH